MKDMTLRKPTASDYSQRVIFENQEMDEQMHMEYVDFMNSIDWYDDLFEEGDLCGVKNTIGEIIVPPLYDDLKLSSASELKTGDALMVKKNDLWGILNVGKQEWYLQPAYDYLGDPAGLCSVAHEGKWGMFDIKKGEFLMPLICESVEMIEGRLFVNGTCIFKIDGKYGVLVLEGDMTEAIFDEVDPDPEGWVKVRIKDQWGYINEEGQFTDDSEEAYFDSSFDRFL